MASKRNNNTSHHGRTRELVKISRKFREIASFKNCRRSLLLVLHIYSEKVYKNMKIGPTGEYILEPSHSWTQRGLGVWTGINTAKYMNIIIIIMIIIIMIIIIIIKVKRCFLLVTPYHAHLAVMHVPGVPLSDWLS